jgi:hypothetical protein
VVGALGAPRGRAAPAGRAAELLRISRVFRNTFRGGPKGVVGISARLRCSIPTTPWGVSKGVVKHARSRPKDAHD